MKDGASAIDCRSAAIRILTADDRGVPLTAICPCGWTWDRPDGDDWADTLPEQARGHRA